ncbi:MAG: gene transfer agent family protein [Erythrobacter sp.]|uniref:gene transfer agent family protein n=1 Tax=Erythrobacter sp. TaxID=1042 RepID=UPI002622CA73|nr:gene transfer agent family protein [Erythrobacter sp.]MDJ0979500.1 gene transfer agent family protein [Erythrobacter sp.]
MNRRANPLRGEANFTIGSRDFVLRPSFENLVAAEDELGSLFALVERASAGALTLSEMTALVWHCLPADQRPERAIVGEAMLDIGLVRATNPVRAILAQALQGET